MSELHHEVRGSVHVLELDRPHRLNALSRELVDALHGGIDDAERDGARALVIVGRGRAFCAGFDLKQELSRQEEDLQMSRMQDLTARLRDISLPSVCAAHGHVVGAGLELALACDVVVATPDAHLSFPDVRAGFAVGGGVTYLLPRLIGLARARMVLLTGGGMSGAEAHAIGMIATTVPADRLHAEALSAGERLADLEPEAVLRVRTAIDASLGGGLREALDRELGDMIATKHAAAGETAVRNFRAHGSYAAPASVGVRQEQARTAQPHVSVGLDQEA